MKTTNYTFYSQIMQWLTKKIFILFSFCIILFSDFSLYAQCSISRTGNGGSFNGGTNGNNIWNCYALRGRSRGNPGSLEYRGFYTLSTTSIIDDFGNCSPNQRTGYTPCSGCNNAVGDANNNADNFSVVYRRQNFPCAKYNMRIAHNDEARVVINGSQLYDTGSCCGDANVVRWTGYLGSGSTSEVRLVESGGGAGMFMYLDDVTPAITSGSLTLNGQANDFTVCSGSTVTIAQAGGSFPEATYYYWIGLNNGSGWVNSWLPGLEGFNANVSSFNQVFNTPGNYVIHSNAINNTCGWAKPGNGVTRFITVTNGPGLPTGGNITNPGTVCLTAPLNIYGTAATAPSPGCATVLYTWWALPPGGSWQNLAAPTGASLSNQSLTAITGNAAGSWTFLRRAYTNVTGSIFSGTDAQVTFNVEQLSDALAGVATSALGNTIDVGTNLTINRTGGTPTARWYIADHTNNFIQWNIQNFAGPSASFNQAFNESGSYLVRPYGINSCGVNFNECCGNDLWLTVRSRTIVEVTPSFEDNCGSGVSLTANAWHHINRGLVAYYNFNGNNNDQSGNNHHAVFPDGGQGARDPRYTEDRFGVAKRAILLDGSDDFLSIPTLTDIRGDNNEGNEVTVTYWFRGVNNQSAFRIQNNGWLVAGWSGSNGNGGLHILSNENGTSGVDQSNAINNVRDGQWHHVAVTWQRDMRAVHGWYPANTNKFRAYVDGVLVTERNSVQAALPFIDGIAQIGRFIGNTEFTNGTLDEMRIYRRALTQTEIQQLIGTGQTYNYSWSPGTDLSSTTAQTVVASPNANNNYTVVATTGGGPASNNDAEDRTARIYRAANAIQFNTNQYVQVAPNTALRNVGDFTYEIWARPIAFTSFNTYFENGQWNGNTIGFRQDNASTIGLFINGIVGYNLTYAPLLNQWTHFAVVRSGSTISLFANGSLVGNFTTSFNTAILPTGNLNIGASTHANATQNFNGLLDEFRMWNRALTAAEITARMHARITPTDAYWNNLQAYYKFDEAVGNNNVLDLSGNKNHGTIVNATRVALSPNIQTISGNSSVCYDNSNVAYTVASANTLGRMHNYNWSVTGGSVASGQGTTGINTNWANLGAGSVNLIVTHSNECINEIPTAQTVTVNPNITSINNTVTPTIASGDWLWTGKNGVDYNAGNNWLQIGNSNTFSIPSTAPSNTNNVFILPNSLAANCFSTNEPTILSTTDIGNANNFNVWTGANFHTKGILNVFGNFRNLGNASGNIIAFKGTAAQTVTTGMGAVTTPVVGKSYKKLVVDNSGNSTVTFNDNGYFIDKVEVENGTLTVPNNIKTYTKKAETKKGVNILGEMRVNDCNTPIGTIGSISGPITGLVRNVEYTYSVTAVNNAALYTWNVPPGFIINRGQGTNSIVATLGCAAVAGNVEVVAENSCGTVSNTFAIAVASSLPQPSAISGTSSDLLCGQSYSYSISNVAGATNYVWQVPTNYTIVSGQGTTSITVTLGSNASSGTISVTATGACGDVSPNQTLPVTTIPAPAQPGSITGTTSGLLCGSSYTYSISSVANAVSYTWSFPTGYTIYSGQGTTSVNVTVNSNAVNGNISVSGTNVCGVIGTARTQAISLVTTPAQPGAITGNVTDLCRNTAGYTYSISAVANASSYNWTVPSGYTITGGQGTTAITVTSGTNAGGVISVAAVNVCGASSAFTSSTAITFLAAPATPGAIAGCTSVGAISTGIGYSISAVANATSYTWTVTGGSVASGQGTTSITVNFSRTVGSTSSGSVSVVANGCNGSSAAQTLNLTIGGKATYSHTGGDQTWTAPCGVNVATVKVWGAGGGGGENTSDAGVGGGGAFVMGTTSVSAGQNHTVVVGGGGANATIANAYGGGGAGRNKAWDGGGGGGRSAFRNSSGEEIAIAGGGGGGGARSNRNGGAAAGVGSNGGKGDNCSSYGRGANSDGTVPGGGNNSAGIAWNGTVGGSGGNAEDCCSDNSGGGGGGGFGGGQGGCSGDNDNGGGGGGSSRLSGFSSTSSAGGSGQTPGGGGDSDYASGTGSGGGRNTSGGNGRVVILY